MTPLIFDLIIIGILLLSVVLGFMRGFVNEVFTLCGWLGAGLATIYFMPLARDYGREFIKKPWLADIATAAVIFGVTMGVFTLVSYFATRTLHASKLSFVDRSLGFGFGILRAIVLFGLCFILFSMAYATPSQRPKFVREARTLPFLQASGEWVEKLIPGDSFSIKDKEDGKKADDKSPEDKKNDDELGAPPDALDKLNDEAEKLKKLSGEKAEELTGDTLDEKIDNLNDKLKKTDDQ